MTELTLPKPLQTLLELSKRQVAKVNLTPSENTWQADKISKIGGIGYFPMGETYPTNEQGEPLALLFQLNFAQLADEVDISQLAYELPNQGILQIYVIDKSEGDYGRSNHQIRFWKDDTLPMNDDELNKAINSIKDKMGMYLLPFSLKEQFLMTFEQMPQSCSTYCREFYPLYNQIDELKGKGVSGYLEEYTGRSWGGEYDEYYELYRTLSYNGDGGYRNQNYILGYPKFAQGDLRDWYPEDWGDYISFLQIDTNYFDDTEIMWGDCGIATFYIHPDDLKNQEFANIFYYWDGH